MKHFPLRKFVRNSALAATSLITAYSFAQDFPSKPISIVVPFAAGSPTDIAARALAVGLGPKLNVPVVIDNRPGASQTIAASHVARVPADGYTLLFMNIPGIVAPSVEAKLPYRGLTDFTPISDVLSASMLLVTAPTTPANDIKEFAAMLRANPNAYSYGSSGVGSTTHLAAELLSKELGLNMSPTHVPYRGTQQAVQDLMSGRITFAFATVGAMEFVKLGKLKALALTAEKRDPQYPEVPTMAEAGLRNFQARAVFALVGPKGMEPAVVAKTNAAVNEVLASPALSNQLKALGGISVSEPSSPQDVGRMIQRAVKQWDDVVKSANIQLE